MTSAAPANEPAGPPPGPPELLERLRGALNPQQFEAVTLPEVPALVMSGPGSGKTRVLTHRVEYLLRGLGVAPDNVACLTFTNKAAAEMRERLGRSLEPREQKGLFVGTIHAFCLRLLREAGPERNGGLAKGFLVLSTAQARALLTKSVEQFNATAPRHLHERRKIYDVEKDLSAVRLQRLETPAMYAARVGRAVTSGLRPDVYTLYQAAKRRNGAVDFNDIMFDTHQMLERDAATRARFATRYRHMLVDEYQDTSLLQVGIIRRLCEVHNCPFAVGDARQSIYLFRFADATNVTRFRQAWPRRREVNLDQNYRSSPQLVALANAVAGDTAGGAASQLRSENPPGPRPTVVACPSQDMEGATVAAECARLREAFGWRWRDFAVLYRINSQSRAPETSLRAQGIPYRLVGAVSFYEREEVQDVVSFVHLMVAPRFLPSFSRAVQLFAGIGPKTVQKIEASLEAQASRWLVAGGDPGAYHGPMDVVRGIVHARRKASREAVPEDLRKARLGKVNKEALARFLAVYDAAVEILRGGEPVSVVLERVLRLTEFEDRLRRRHPGNAEERWQNVQELVESARALEEEERLRGLEDGEEAAGEAQLRRFVQAAALHGSKTEEEAPGAGDGEGAVHLSTVHSAKGLEFRCVFLIGANDGTLPFFLATTDAQLNEERRVLFVGATRAERVLTITYPQVSRGRGQRLSRFLAGHERSTSKAGRLLLDKGRVGLNDIVRQRERDWHARRLGATAPPAGAKAEPAAGDKRPASPAGTADELPPPGAEPAAKRAKAEPASS